ncbi:hypothetical protein AVEN_136339-1 [Araneus ventricosus]|uniref:Pre-C2HC domain-containing protein n=1 Tax=Araneus ventricosus TaxID=182803 RepID=A0A4Y2E4V8_ARAVE|nr:hypothetical protein AVEN_136339-1 [Araneus ventricosus]
MTKPVNYRDLLKQINEIEGIKCNAKEAGEFIKLFCETARDVKKLTEFLDKNNKEYFVIPGKAVKPIKVVIKGLPKDTDLDEIKTELVNKEFRVEKVNQLKSSAELLPHLLQDRIDQEKMKYILFIIIPRFMNLERPSEIRRIQFFLA